MKKSTGKDKKKKTRGCSVRKGRAPDRMSRALSGGDLEVYGEDAQNLRKMHSGKWTVRGCSRERKRGS